MPQPFTYEEFKEIYSKVPRLTVEVVVETENGILLTKRNTIPFKGYWHFPGGTVYHKETLHEAAKRVAREEVGIEIQIKKLIGFIEYRSLADETPFDYPISILFSAEIVSGQPKPVSQSDAVDYFHNLPQECIPEQAEFLRYNQLIK